MIEWPEFDRAKLDERDMLHAVLQQQRAIMVWKLDGLSRDQATRPMAPTGTNLLGMVKHLAWVELWWFCEFIDGQDRDRFGHQRESEFVATDEETIESVVSFYAEAIGHADDVIRNATSLEVTGTLGDEDRSLRWVLAHMIEETARHAGQADIIRELIDGSTGYYPE